MPNDQYSLSTSSVFGSAAWVGSLVIESAQPLAARVQDATQSSYTRTSNAAAGGNSTLYVPAAYKNKWGMTAGVVVQNLGGATATPRLYFYDRDGAYRTTVTLSTLSPQRAAGVWLGNVSQLGSYLDRLYPH